MNAGQFGGRRNVAELLGGHYSLARGWWYSDSRGTRRAAGLGPQLCRGDCVQWSQRLLWAVEVRGGVFVEGALGRA